ncbi:hypothetical protein HKX48_008797 [Thoreauomyces humboldtii]|nr:hypothetical protein HKX48_008797 [Thoreauomyces humboldtii]
MAHTTSSLSVRNFAKIPSLIFNSSAGLAQEQPLQQVTLPCTLDRRPVPPASIMQPDLATSLSQSTTTTTSRALIGRHSKDRVLSVFLDERTLAAYSDGSFPSLTGLVSVNASLKDEHVPCVQLRALLTYKTALGVTVNRIIYSRILRLDHTEADSGASTASLSTLSSTISQRTRYPFTFSFAANEALAPSLALDAGSGLRWEVIGYLAPGLVDHSPDVGIDGSGVICVERINERRSPVALPLLVTSSYAKADDTEPLTASKTVGSGMFASGNLGATIAGTALGAVSSSSPVLILSLSLTSLLASHAVGKVRVTAKQKVTVRDPSGRIVVAQKFRVGAKWDDRPAPRYDTGSGRFDIVCEVPLCGSASVPSKGLKNGKSGAPARVIPLTASSSTLTFKDEEGMADNDSLLAPSMPEVSAPTGSWSASVTYMAKIVLMLLDSAGGFGSKEREITLSVPFDVIASTPASASTIVPSVSTLSLLTVPTTADAILPLLSETLTDIDHSLSALSTLLDAVPPPSASEAARVSVTTPADHARELLHILIHIDSHMRSAFLSASPSWPRNPVPFNVMVLETELMCRAVGAVGLETVVQGVAAYVTACRRVAVGWCERGKTWDDVVRGLEVERVKVKGLLDAVIAA